MSSQGIGNAERLLGEAVNTAVFILNRLWMKALHNMTPYEAWEGKKPAVHFMRTFGCIVHVKVTRLHAKKFDDKSIKMVFVGYEPGSKGYRVYDQTFNVEYTVNTSPGGEQGDAHVSLAASHVFTPYEEERHTPVDGKQAKDANRIKFVSSPSSMPSGMEHDDEGASRCYRTVANCIATSEPQ
ncbi:hypothetical protein AXG93_4225s1340 [Marchantia polymorpha subsp. ruderalis]|uniref:Retroviral polymerase SH3-like domain-containing protein n=1 Tax=Marchantia polymorpha subsp. ruderalis TaxID=1480154 RepID=A0A176WRT6_MARPO|nr:hypothetical protein AXG93_4225s1340 [Marchantia polymorpha subsp. ruderalis]